MKTVRSKLLEELHYQDGGNGTSQKYFLLTDLNSADYQKSGQSDYPRTPQDTPGHPRTRQDSIIYMFNILYDPVDDGLVLVCWCFN